MLNRCLISLVTNKKHHFQLPFLHTQLLKHCHEVSPTYTLREKLDFPSHVALWKGASASPGPGEECLLGSYSETHQSSLPFYLAELKVVALPPACILSEET